MKTNRRQMLYPASSGGGNNASWHHVVVSSRYSSSCDQFNLLMATVMRFLTVPHQRDHLSVLSYVNNVGGNCTTGDLLCS